MYNRYGIPKQPKAPKLFLLVLMIHVMIQLCCRYINEPREALKEFNFARKDSTWGAQAVMHMVEVSKHRNPG